MPMWYVQVKTGEFYGPFNGPARATEWYKDRGLDAIVVSSIHVPRDAKVLSPQGMG